MKKKEVLEVTEMLSTFIEAGAGAQELMKAITEKNLHKNSNFIFVFHTLKAWIESDNPEVKLTKTEKSVLFTFLPYVGWNNQIELLQEDMQRLCGYKDRSYFSKVLNTLVKKNVLEKQSVGKQNYWFFNSLLVKKGNNKQRKPYIKFDLKD
ncbi:MULTISPECIES: hypothetical protein [Bacillus cereus group]|uniref:hypothetical protein n=1 Tax=Bacillus cereus group TaxID=86661 RepID=UPI00065BBB88|nr:MULTISPECIES: hypothetical protein [Bacillus cereus group]KMP15890.1 hypothetical protein TU49_23895 [Bacillus cereus]MBX5315651.1 hypothetical protein [Rhizobium sp. NLR11b]HBK4897626.1 hypothetical protein [Listeria monocytogenes]MCU5204013.1 hypothetical protein [Bacillus paranthracis]MDA1576841.1 hypothetical protein [Bacillus cereus group sp. TH242-3LC]